MTVGELIQQLQQFPGSAGVVVEVTPEVAAETLDEGETVFADLHNVGPECRSGNAVKLTLA